MPVPPFPRILLGPGPSAVAPRVLEACSRPPVGYLDPELFQALAEIQEGLRPLFGTSSELTIAMTGTGMAAMEACFANLVEPGDQVLVGVHGFFGARMVEVAARCGARVTRVDAEWGQPLDPARMEEAASALDGRVKLVACVHAETSTGVRQPLEPISALARRLDALLLVDAVTSLGGIPVDMDGCGVDACYSASQKCLGCPPGLAPVSVSSRALEAVAARRTPVQSWYHDWSLIGQYWRGEHAYHHTVPVCALMGLREALRAIHEEGLEARFDRHLAVSGRLLAGLDEMGLRPFAGEGHRLPMLCSVWIPDGVDDVAVRTRLLAEWGIEIGGGLGALKGRIWRIGLMGESATPRNVDLLLAALRRILVQRPGGRGSA